MNDFINRIEEFFQDLNEQKLSRKNFLKSLLLLSGTLVFLSKPEEAYAHPPVDIQLNFDSETKILKAVIIHPVSNPQKHFINKVEVGLNAKEIIAQSIRRQDNQDNQTVSYLIPDIEEGDLLSVEAYCSISGKLKKEIKVTLEK